jgi:outer membrane receptor for ferrienterochelin and colicins
MEETMQKTSNIYVIIICLLLFIFMQPVYAETKLDLKLTGTIKSYEGRPITEALVLIPGIGKATESDEQGKFEILAVPSGKYHLEVYADGYMDYKSDSFVISEDSKSFTIILMKKISEEIVVTATRTPKLYIEVPVKTQIITARRIEQKQATDLAEAISLTTGVRVENNCQNCNFTQVRINGMEGKYSQILIDSSPVFSSMIGVYGLEQIPAEMLSRIEIIKGGGSALYGGNAVAGVINVQTKEPVENSSAFEVHQEFQDGEPLTNAGFRTGFVSNKDNTKAFLFANYKDRQPVDINQDGFSEVGKMRSTNFGLNFYNYFPGADGKLKLSFYRITENRRGGNKFDLPPHQADIAEAIDTDLNGLSGEWNHYLSNRLFYNLGVSYVDAKRDTYYGSEQDLNAYGSSKNPVLFLNGQMNYQAGAHLLSGGIQYKGERIDDKALGYGREIDKHYSEFGVFLQDDVKLSSLISLLAGLRVSKHSLIFDPIFNPRLSLLINLTDDISWRSSFSTGFRAPQVFDEDLHITQVGGEGMIIENSPELEEESSYSLSTGLDFGRQLGQNNVHMSVEGFYTVLTETFILTQKEFDQRENALVFERINGSSSRVFGVSAEVGCQFSRFLNMMMGGTWQQSRLDEPEPDFGSRDLFRNPNIYGHFTLNYVNDKLVDADLSLEYTGSMKIPHFAGAIPDDRLETSEPFCVVNGKVTRTVSLNDTTKVDIFAGVFNLFDSYQDDLDTGLYRDAGYVYGPSKPRSVYTGLKFSF